MRRLVAAAPILLLAALLSACGGDAKPSPTPVPFPSEAWSLEYSTSGGIAGISQRLVLDWKGNLMTEDRRQNRTRQGYVVPSDVAMIAAGLRGSNLTSLKSDEGLPKPDAILTSIKVFSQDKVYGATFNTTPESREIADVLRRLAAVYETNGP